MILVLKSNLSFVAETLSFMVSSKNVNQVFFCIFIQEMLFLQGLFVWNIPHGQTARTQGNKWCEWTGLDLHLPQCVKTLDVRLAEQRHYSLLFTGGSSDGVPSVMASNESLVPKNHFTMDLSKGKFKEEFTRFVFFTLFVSLEHYGATNSVSDHAVHVILGSKTRRFCSPHNVQVWPRLFAHGHSLGLRYWQSFFSGCSERKEKLTIVKAKMLFSISRRHFRAF